MIAHSGQVIMTANQRRSGTHHFHPEHPSCPLTSCPVSKVRFVPGADVADIGM